MREYCCSTILISNKNPDYQKNSRKTSNKQKHKKESRIRKTLNLSTDADCCTSNFFLLFFFTESTAMGQITEKKTKDSNKINITKGQLLLCNFLLQLPCKFATFFFFFWRWIAYVYKKKVTEGKFLDKKISLNILRWQGGAGQSSFWKIYWKL